MISLTELVRGARSFVEGMTRPKPGEDILVIVDNRVEYDVVRAYETAIASLGANPYTQIIPYVRRHGEEGEESDFHKVTRLAMYGADVALIVTTELYHPALRSIVTACAEYGTRVIVPCPYEPEVLISEYCTFPLELLQAIQDKQTAILRRGEWFRLTCEKGSDFRARIMPEAFFPTVGLVSPVGAKQTPLGCPGSNFTAAGVLCVPRFKGSVPGASGVLYMDEVEGCAGGITGYCRWLIEEKDGYSWVTAIEGGKEAQWQWQMINKIKNGNLFSEAMWGLHPKVGVRSNVHYLYGQHAAGIDPTRHAGVIHFAMGSPPSRTEGHLEVAAPIHTHGHMFQPSIYIDDTLIIDKGHMVVLDDPEIRDMAKKYGDPDDVLAEYA